MARYSDFLVEVRPVCSEAPTPTIESEIRRSVIEFCQRSRVWRQELVLRLEAGKQDYQVIADGQARADEILQAKYSDDKDREWVLKKARHGDFSYGPESQQAKIEPPRYYSELPDTGGIRLYPSAGDATDNPVLGLYVVAVPTRRSRSFPDHLAEKHWDAIVHGAKWRLLSIEHKPWFDPQMAEYHRRQHFTGVNRARRESLSENWSPTQVRQRRWV